MKRNCRVPNCERAAGSKWAAYCTYHRNHSRRHGHPTQKPIVRKDRRQFVSLIQDLRDRNPESKLWPHLESIWGAVTEDARRVMTVFERRTAFVSMDDVRVAHELLRLDKEASPRKVADCCMSMVMLQDQHPGLFESDEAFLFQLSRQAMRVIPLQTGERYNHVSGRITKVYRDLPKRTMRKLGQTLLEAFGSPALLILNEMEKRVKEEKDRKREIVEAVTELNFE